MSGAGVLLDSVILIDHLNGISSATDFLREAGPKACISAITRAEVLTGVKERDRAVTTRFLDCFVFLAIDKRAADLAADLRRVHRWKLPDAFQAAIAQLHDLSLATRDTDGFNPRRHRFVLVPYTLSSTGD
jgi:predicted nucleic acid-binding protein